MEKVFVAEEHSNQIDDTVLNFELNKELFELLQIIQLAYIKSIKDVSWWYGWNWKIPTSWCTFSFFFSLQKESHWFVIVTPIGSAVALLGGLTYHSMFGINDFNRNSQLLQGQFIWC